jgi:hypothetical protein
MEDHGDPISMILVYLVVGNFWEVPAVEKDFAGDNLAWGLREKTQDGHHGRTLASTALSNDSQSLTFVQVERNTSNLLYHPILGSKLGL